jgi:hypothetical protein
MLRASSGVTPQDLERAGGDGTGPIGVVADGSDALADAGIVEPESPVAVGVEGERDVTPLGQPVGTLAMHVVQAWCLVSHQHGGQGPASFVVRYRQMPDHHDPAVRLVLDLARRQHPPEPTTRPTRRATNLLRIRPGVGIADLDIRIVHAATGEILRRLTLDPTRDYQPTGKPGPTPTQTNTARTQ